MNAVRGLADVDVMYIHVCKKAGSRCGQKCELRAVVAVAAAAVVAVAAAAASLSNSNHWTQLELLLPSIL